MSSNFWTSSHSSYHLHPRSSLLSSRSLDLQYCTPRQHYCLQIYFSGLLQKLGKRLLLRQIPIATATVYFKRFYLRNAICETNPYLVLAACAYVAAKIEETPVHIKSVVAEAKAVFAGLSPLPVDKSFASMLKYPENNIKLFPADSSKLGEMEFYLLEDLDFHLIVFHPYRALLAMTGREAADGGKWPKSRVEEDLDVRKKEKEREKDKGARVGKEGSEGREGKEGKEGETGVESEEARIRRLMARGSGEGLMEVDEGVVQISLFLINDTYRTDLPLLYPPYLIALAALYVGYCLTASNAHNSNSNANSNSTSNPTTATAASATAPGGTTPRTRSSTQQTDTSLSIQSNAALGLPPPPTAFAEFFASFQVSLPALMSCVQDMVLLYPMWEGFEPTQRGAGGAGGAGGMGGVGGVGGGGMAALGRGMMGVGGATGTAGVGSGGSRRGSGAGKGGVGETTTTATTTEMFGPTEAEALVRKMIEDRAVDLLHPDYAGKQIIGRKRKA